MPRSKSPTGSRSRDRSSGSTKKSGGATDEFLEVMLFGNDSAMRWTVIPLFLMVTCPLFAVILVSKLFNEYEGSLLTAWDVISNNGIGALFTNLPAPSWAAGKLILLWALVQAVLLKVVPGPTRTGPATVGGFAPPYHLNGAVVYVITQVGVVLAWYKGYYSAAHVLDLYPEAAATLSVFSLLLVAVLQVKGRYFPTHKDADSAPSGHAAFDFWWGVELYPYVAGISLKQWFNCRWSMMFWASAPIVFSLAQAEIYGEISYTIFVSTALMFVYLFKFFVWEEGYFHSIDIHHDRFGFYIAWGVLCWVPTVYCSYVFSLVHAPSDHGFKPYAGFEKSSDEVAVRLASRRNDHGVKGYTFEYAVANFVAGILAIALNYYADLQRQHFRRTNTLPFGEKVKYVTCRYTHDDGVERKNKMLVSGWWGVSRHSNYVFELLAAYLWTLPNGFSRALPWFYSFFLTILLFERQIRDEHRMRQKYGTDWLKVTKAVPSRIIPGIY